MNACVHACDCVRAHFSTHIHSPTCARIRACRRLRKGCPCAALCAYAHMQAAVFAHVCECANVRFCECAIVHVGDYACGACRRLRMWCVRVFADWLCVCTCVWLRLCAIVHSCMRLRVHAFVHSCICSRVRMRVHAFGSDVHVRMLASVHA